MLHTRKIWTSQPLPRYQIISRAHLNQTEAPGVIAELYFGSGAYELIEHLDGLTEVPHAKVCVCV